MFNKNQLANLVEKYAKFQKVMLVYDNFTSNQEMNEIYNEIKKYCIFNKINVNETDKTEIYNGYKMLIFVCSVDDFLCFDSDISEFVNIIVAKESPQLLGFCAYNGVFNKCDFIVLADNIFVDKSAFSSFEFAKFYNQILAEYFQTSENEIFGVDCGCNFLTILNNMPQGVKFVDILILKHQKLPYAWLPIVDFVLISAFEIFFEMIKQHHLKMADIYKDFKDDEEKISKYFLLTQNDSLLALVELNYSNAIIKLKQSYFKILDCVPKNLNGDDVDFVIKAVKKYCKNSDEFLLNCLFLYDVFG